MKPQERIDALKRSKLEPPMRLLLVMLASYMADDRDVVWCSRETLADDTGFSASTVDRLLAEADRDGLIQRVWGSHRSKDTRIVWSAVAAYAPQPSGRGGRQQPRQDNPPNIGGHPPNIGGQPINYPPNIGGQPPEHRGRTDQEPGNRKDRGVNARGGAPVQPDREPTPEPRPTTPPPRTFGRSADQATAALPPDAGLVSVAGYQLPPDLPGLLFGATCGRVDVIRTLADAGLTTTARVLRLPRDRWGYTPKLGEVLALAVEEHLAERWPGVTLGCLAPDPSATGQRGHPRGRDAPVDTTDSDAEVARLTARILAATAAGA